MADENRIETPRNLRNLQRTLYRQAKNALKFSVLDSKPVNHIGKPDAGEPHVRFDEGGWTLTVQPLLYTLSQRFFQKTLPTTMHHIETLSFYQYRTGVSRGLSKTPVLVETRGNPITMTTQPASFFLLSFLFLIIGCPIPGSGEDVAPPNVVVILVDDLRWDELGCTGHPFVRTPHIDRIAREGARFRNAFATTPLCSPNRACLLTGLYTHHHAILDNINRSEQSHELITFPRLLHESGKYETAYIGKWHMGNDPSARPGFDYWVSMKGQGTSFDPELNVNGETEEFTGHTTDVLNQKVVEFVKSDHTKPFCLYIAHKALHPELVQRDDGSITDPSAAKFLPARRHQTLYTEDAIPRRLNVIDDLMGKPALQRPVEGLPPLSRATGTSDDTVRDRLRMLAGIEEGVGQLFSALAYTGQLDNTVIIFTSDHGYWYGEHGLSVERRLAYEEGIRIPLLVRYPPLIEGGKVIDRMALSIDLAPTVLELAGCRPDPAPEFDGSSLVPLLGRDTPGPWRDSFLIEYNSDTVFPRIDQMGYRAIRTERWKYIHYLELEGMDELYDLLNDPYEMDNRINDPKVQPVLEKLRGEIMNYE